MNSKELEKRVIAIDWFFDRQKGSHKIFKHPTIEGFLVIPFHGSKDIPIGTLNSILKKAGLKK
ncbi:addiction module toxin, HicA family [Cryomorpha ignava]|uniref:Addiction module toxin, HicA family n=1 Tax=Cryomorpha ignava TaxID=101383 RepID=A0A7K3WMP2_9FLAO|nr:type II toxin-antitoxin system HicA family toxin [Cryomorpha ignava]NEN22906.1 addiction module toxin, HicA family [Cryomorpha ignava]